MSKILFVYPNKEGYPIIPLGISILSGVLKYHKHKAELFDITFMMPDRLDHNAREKTGVVKKVDMGKYWGVGDTVDINEEFNKKILAFNPDLLAFSIVENNYGCAKTLFNVAKQITKVPIIVGGLFPTIAPDFFIQDKNVDIICIGEGEYAMLELANRLDNRQNIDDIPNLIVKTKSGEIIKNKFAKYYDWNPLIFQDWDIFDKRHLLKPFMGKMWRTGFFELSRGCPSNCSYCINKKYQEIFKYLGNYNRRKPIDYTIKEMEYMKIKYNLELIFFNDENFLIMKQDMLEDFCKKYKEKINLPFFIMTRADSLINEEKVKLLKNSNCITIGIGVESGNEEIRKHLLNKHIPNSVYEKAFENCHKYNIRTTANVMIGLPFETEENILETANFCRILKAKSISISIFAPYHGTKLYDMCIKNGFIEDKYNEDISINYSSILTMPQLSKERLVTLYYKFNDMVYKNNEVFLYENNYN